jgi:hypothetical protein
MFEEPSLNQVKRSREQKLRILGGIKPALTTMSLAEPYQILIMMSQTDNMILNWPNLKAAAHPTGLLMSLASPIHKHSSLNLA